MISADELQGLVRRSSLPKGRVRRVRFDAVSPRDKKRLASAERSRRWRLEHPERAKAVVKRWRARNQERIRAARKRWNQANPDKRRLMRKVAQRRLYKRNPEKFRRLALEWRARQDRPTLLAKRRAWWAKNKDRVNAEKRAKLRRERRAKGFARE